MSKIITCEQVSNGHPDMMGIRSSVRSSLHICVILRLRSAVTV